MPINRITSVVCLLACMMAGVSTASAKTIYVNANAVADTGNGASEATAKKYLGSAVALMGNGGDTVMVMDGVYSNVKDRLDYAALRSGSSSQGYNVIRAQHDGLAVIKAGFDFYGGRTPLPLSYLRFEGLKWDTQEVKAVIGNHIKFLRCAFQGGPPLDNASNLDIGTNDFTPGAQYILIEDSWLYGPGGRYNISIYNSDAVILRRVVVRHDGGWSDSEGDPEAGINFYNSSNVEIQNSIVLDSNLATYKYWESAFYSVSNDSSANHNRNTRITGSISLNNLHDGFSYDDSVATINARLENSVAWGTDGGVSVNGGAHQLFVDHVLIGNTAGHALANWSSQGATLSVTNSIFYRNPGDAFHGPGFTQSNNNCSSGGNCGAAAKSYDAAANGLSYLPRIENPSTLRSDDIGITGDQLTQRIGVSGTLFGDPGYATGAGDNLWPWPNEVRLKNDMCASMAVTRGFCSAPSLTEYVWTALGNPAPPSLPMSAPTKLRAIKSH